MKKSLKLMILIAALALTCILFACGPKKQTYTLTYIAGTGGSISGTLTQEIEEGKNGSLVTARPDTGYIFDGWSDGVATAARTDTNITADKTVTALFSKDKYTLTYTTGTGGSITGILSQKIEYDSYGTQVTAMPDTGYSFNKWSDGITTASRTDKNVITDITVMALFSKNKYVITFNNYDGTQLQTGLWEYGSTPIYSGMEPAKQGTAEYVYVFSWDSAITAVTGAQTYTAQFVSIPGTYGLTYRLNSDYSSYSVTGIGTATANDIIIPNVYRNLPITNIDNNTFSNCTSLTSITFPSSVTSIGEFAFFNCTSLKRINSTVDGEFDLSTLTSLTSISHNVFYNCTSLISIIIPNSITSIGSRTFYDCTKLKIINSTVDGEFDLSGLLLISIGHNAFVNCKSLTSIIIPTSIKNIDDYAFGGCTNLKRINSSFDGKFDLSALTLITNLNCFRGCTSLTSIIIPSSVTSIGDSAFYNCTNLKRINNDIDGEFDLSGLTSLTSIGDSAFYNCTNLISIIIPSGVTSIDGYAFYGCTSLITLSINRASSQGITSLGTNAFYNCPIANIYVPSDSVIDYQNAENWNVYSAYITAI